MTVSQWIESVLTPQGEKKENKFPDFTILPSSDPETEGVSPESPVVAQLTRAQGRQGLQDRRVNHREAPLILGPNLKKPLSPAQRTVSHQLVYDWGGGEAVNLATLLWKPSYCESSSQKSAAGNGGREA